MHKRYSKVPFSALNGILLQFNNAVKENKKWKKFEYKSWRKLSHFIDINTRKNKYAEIEYTDYSVTIQTEDSLQTLAGTDNVCIIGHEDDGFTGFLLEKLKECYPEMTTTTNTTTANTITYSGQSTSTAMPSYNYTTISTPNYVVSSNWEPINKVEINKDGIFIGGKKVLTEEDPMTTKDFGLNFDFGPVNDNKLAVCPFGIAAKNSDGGYCYYDPEKYEIVDCSPFTFDTKQFLFKMPMAISAINVGDVIIHRGLPMFVKGLEDEHGRILAIDIAGGEEKYILPTRNMFGFNFVTKVVSLLDMKNCGASTENPFGNMLPLLMLMKDDKDLDPMMLLMMNSGQIGGMNMDAFTKNPLMMYIMMKDNKNLKDMLPFLMMTSIMPAQK